MVKEVRGNERNGYEHLARAEVTAGGAPLVVSGSPNWTGEDSDRVYAQFAAYSGQVPAGRLASALVRMLSSFGAVRLRPTGGIYYLPGAKLARWQEAVAVVEGAGKNAVYLMQQSLTPETVRAVRDALTAEIEAAAARIEEEILSGDLGERALATRVSEAAALRVKAEAYESILGVGLDHLKGLADKVGQTHLMGTLMSNPMGAMA